MGVEIERKFLLVSEAWRRGAVGQHYRQGYLCTDPERTVRVRVAGTRAMLTIKGRTVGASRAEFEYAIPLADAEAMLALCLPPLIDKTRYSVMAGGRMWEVDEFHGLNAGLVVAEVELEAEDAPLELPEWVGAEVTGQRAYYNSCLVCAPYSTWDHHDSHPPER